MKFSSLIWALLILGMPLMYLAQKCTISPRYQDLVATLSKGNLKFALNTYKDLAKKENLVFSPFSISVALAMTAAGAGGNTLTQMNDVLNLDDFTKQKRINQAFSTVLGSICSNYNYTLLTARRIYIQKSFPIMRRFLNTLSNYYEASAKNVDFSGKADVAAQINTWVERKTNNTIKNIFPPQSLDRSTVLVLVTAIYFKGTWQNPFDQRATRAGQFTLSNGQTMTAAIMSRTDKFNYAKSSYLRSKILQLNYAGDRLVMYAILPNRKDGLAQLQQRLTPKAFKSLRQKMSIQKVTVNIPKFELNFERKLNGLLRDLGMTDLFKKGKANLKGISNPNNANLYVSTVKHKTFISVDEEGTTAAAASDVQFSLLSLLRSPPNNITFNADHPFIFVIYDTATNLILFMGNVDKPKDFTIPKLVN